MQRWEHRQLSARYVRGRWIVEAASGAKERLDAVLSRLGGEGWEAVGMSVIQMKGQVTGGEYLFKRPADGGVDPTRASEDVSRPSLTERERQVLAQVAKGMTNRDIALNLGITETVVKGHLANVYEKLHVTSRMEAVIIAIKDRLVDLDGD